MTALREWLAALGLERYEGSFVANDIDLDVLPELSEEELERLGVSLGDRKRLRKAVSLLAASGKMTQAAKTTVAPSLPGEAERRQLTVLFCDLVNSTALAQRLDPEDLRAVISDYHRTCAEVVRRFEGYVAKYMGDGVLCYFGYPQAHENDAERSVRAGLEIVVAVAQLDAAQRRGDSLAVRIGIATGQVVVGDLIGEGAAREEAVVGATLNLAARLQSAASPGAVLVSDATRKLIAGAFDWTDLGAQSLKGFPDPERVWRALGESSIDSRFAAAAARGLTPLVGRQSELALLDQRWAAAQKGDGQVVLLTGEPGIGKSRIAEAFLERRADEHAARLRYFCSPFHAHSAFYPFAAQIGRTAALRASDAAVVKLDKIEAWLLEAGYDPGQLAPLIANLLGVAVDGRYPPLDLAPNVLRQKIFDAIETLVLGFARRQPVLALFEDAHWIDPTSRELLDRLIEATAAHPLLMIVTARPEFEAAWSRLPHATALTLNHLGRADSARLVAELARGQGLMPEAIERLARRGQGVPLFLEELTRSVLEAPSSERASEGGPRMPEIPATLRDSLMARLDRLGPAKEIAQAAAVIGREFDDAMLSEIVAAPAEARRDSLDRLVRSQLIARRGAEGQFQFRHALIQDAAYQSLLNATRRGYHRRLAAALEQRYPERLATEPEIAAHHCAEAGDDEGAIRYWLRAGQHSARHSANLESITHLRNALERLRRQDGERPEQELPMLIALGPALMATRGWNAPEVKETYARALRFAEATGRTEEVFPAVWGRWLINHGGGEAVEARALMQQLFALANGQQSPDLLLQAHHAGASNNCTDGEFIASQRDVEACIALYDFETHKGQALVYGGHDPSVCVHCIGALNQFMLGNYRRSRALGDGGLDLAARVGHTPSIVHATWYRAELSHILGDATAAEAAAERVLVLATEKGMTQYIGWAMMILGWTCALRGDRDGAIAKMEDGFKTFYGSGMHYHLPHRLALRADTYAAAGRADRAVEAIAEAALSIERTGEKWYEAEVLRMMAKIRLARSPADHKAAEALLEEALAAARARHARGWELRIAADLAALLQRQERDAAARTLLRPLVDSFAGETESGDLKRARSVLAS